jgi:NAD(P)-dependent dehydrogenase (short-subunit alcohol dehydrogenase family)
MSRARGAVTIPGDASERESLAAALERASSEIGSPDLIVNAVSPARPTDGGTAFGVARSQRRRSTGWRPGPSPWRSAAMAARLSRDALVRHEDAAHAVDFLATESPRGMTHEVVVTPMGWRWIP